MGIGPNHASFVAGFRSTYFWDYSRVLLTRSLQQWQHVQNTSTFDFGTVNFWDTIRNLPGDPALGDQGGGGGGGRGRGGGGRVGAGGRGAGGLD